MTGNPVDLYCKDLRSLPQPGLGRVLVTGATGYIGGRLVPELLARGYAVRVMIRYPSPGIESRWPGAEVVVADALHGQTLEQALQGVHCAYYLIHSLLLGPGQFESADLLAARNFRLAAQRAGVGRIVYLGGLGDREARLSAHLRSRMLIAEELRAGPVPVTILRAAIIIGSGSASYEIMEHLVRNLVVLPIPGWARSRCQPIAIGDVVKYLVGVLEEPGCAGRSFDIGGPEILSYERLLRIQADVLGMKRFFVPAPPASIGFYSYIASLVTPVPHQITHCLMEGIVNDVVCEEEGIRGLIPFQTVPMREALVRALSREEQDRMRTRWSDAYPPAHELAIKLRELAPPPNYTTTYSVDSRKDAGDLFRSTCLIGGSEGWFHSNWMWKLRGWVDRLLLGVGTARGRRSRTNLRVHDVIDFWRVEEIERDRKLLLRAEMKVPGKAWLQFEITRHGDVNRLTVTAFYQALTLFGRLYWYAFLPFHVFIFRDLISQIEKRSVPPAGQDDA